MGQLLQAGPTLTRNTQPLTTSLSLLGQCMGDLADTAQDLYAADPPNTPHPLFHNVTVFITAVYTQDGLAAATSDEVHITRDREYGVQPRRRGCMHYLRHQGQQSSLLTQDDQHSQQQQGKDYIAALVFPGMGQAVDRLPRPQALKPVREAVKV